MTDTKKTVPNGDGDPLEYFGHMKFGPAEGKPVTPESTLEDWLERARGEFMLSRVASVIYNATDEEMEAWVRDAENPDEVIEMFSEIADSCNACLDSYKAGVDVFNAVIARCIVIGERTEAQYKAN